VQSLGGFVAAFRVRGAFDDMFRSLARWNLGKTGESPVKIPIGLPCRRTLSPAAQLKPICDTPLDDGRGVSGTLSLAGRRKPLSNMTTSGEGRLVGEGKVGEGGCGTRP
jgi:hypothetical protein